MATKPTTHPGAQWPDQVPQAQLGSVQQRKPVLYTDEFGREGWTFQATDDPDGAVIEYTDPT